MRSSDHLPKLALGCQAERAPWTEWPRRFLNHPAMQTVSELPVAGTQCARGHSAPCLFPLRTQEAACPLQTSLRTPVLRSEGGSRGAVVEPTHFCLPELVGSAAVGLWEALFFLARLP